MGIIGFMSAREDSLIGAQLKGLPLHIHTNVRLKDAELVNDSPVLRIARPGGVLWGALPGNDWTVFTPNHSTYQPVETASLLVADEASGGLPGTNLISVLRVSTCRD